MKSSFLAAITLLMTACGPADGTVRVNVYGEEYIEDELPADIFSDGWSVTYDKFLVSLGAVTVAMEGESPELSLPSTRIYDLSRSSEGAGWDVGEGGVPGGDYHETGYTIAPAANAVAANASGQDVTLMADGGYAIWLEGTATKATDTKTFAFGFTGGTRYGRCHSEAEVDGDTAAIELTIHGDHLFYDDLFSEAPNVSFQLVADADTDGDGVVAKDELWMMSLTTQERYQVGSTGIDNLWDFIEYQSATLGHIDGEGHCEDALRE